MTLSPISIRRSIKPRGTRRVPPLPLDRRRRRDALRIGLVNNMPDAALRSTERQFRDLLASAAGERAVELKLFSFPELPRSADGQSHVREHHEPIERLWDGEFDGLIVTGTAPLSAAMEEEPCWPTLTRLVDWAERHTASTIWSCLAAHAAVRHLDGIERRPLGGKLSGVFACERTSSHPLLGFGPSRWRTPHSRYNDLPEAALVGHGYRILSRSPEAGVDIFIKQRDSLFVFLQGHPEYDAGALYREYRRDVSRFLGGDSDAYPQMPVGYLSDDVVAAMQAFRDRAFIERDPELLAVFPTGPAIHAPWRHTAVALFANWLTHLGAQHSRRFGWPGSALPFGAERRFTPTYA
jgi:homoserine O-succinyltransferase